jgi:DEAD/DEAH box helicase domain-containing protein
MGGKRQVGGDFAPPTPIDKSTWPQFFLELQKVHRSVCTFHTFFASTRKNVTITYEVLKSATRKDLSRDLEELDLAMIKSLMPSDVLFEYMDENQLAVDADVRPGEGATSEVKDIYDPGANEPSKQLLVFDFIDGTVKPERKKAKTSGVTRISKRTVKRPAYAVADIRKMIEKRVNKFEQTLDAFVKCNEQAVEVLHKRSKTYLPKLTSYSDPIEDMYSTSSVNGARYSPEEAQIDNFIEHLKSSTDYRNQIVPGGEMSIPRKEPVYSTLIHELSEEVQAVLKYRGIEKLYCHQVDAFNALEEGKDVIITTSTSSGKSLVYQLPAIQALERDSTSTALYIFPTKALAQDQKSSLQKLLFSIPSLRDIRVDTYDGDTPVDQREDIRKRVNVVFTNPDMIHCSILPSWQLWAPFLRNLKYLVVDELHMYSGLFGTHVSLIMRRLRRICDHLGNSDFQIICCSATIRQPESLMKVMFGLAEPPVVITEDGAPHGEKHILVWNCPYISPNDPNSGRIHPVSEAANMMVDLVARGIRTIAFCKVRRTCELMMKSVREILKNTTIPNGSEILTKIMSYRGGYSAHDRRKIEAEMFHGNLLGIVATNSLELGIDIGNLDAVLIVGFPFSVSNLRQQMGRAGRRSKDSFAVLLGSGDPVDQFYMTNPEEIFTAPNTEIVLSLDNTLILESHIQCAAHELAATTEDGKYFGQDIKELLSQRLEILEELSQNDTDIARTLVAYTCHSRFLPKPADHVSIRGREEDEFAVVDITNGRNQVVETVESSRTSFTLYEGGIFLHQGCQYLVKEFNPKQKFAKIERVQVDWMTRQRDFHDVDPIEIETLQVLESGEGTAFFGKIRNTFVVFGFFKFDKQNRIIDAVEVDYPPYIFESKGFWIDIPVFVLKILEGKQLSMAGAIHGAEHAVLSLISNFVTAATGDVGTECKAPEKEFSKRLSERRRPARLIFYDNVGGYQGCGIANKAYEFVNELIKQAADRVSCCPCTFGCPECVAARDCKEKSEVISKTGALIILSILAGRDIDIAAVGQGPEENLKGKVRTQTIIPATQVALSSTQLI